MRAFFRAATETALFAVLSWSPLAVLGAEPPPPDVAVPELENTPELVAVSIGGGVVVAHVVDNDEIVRSDGGRSANLTALTATATGLPACSRITSTATARMKCEADARNQLARRSPSDFKAAKSASFTSDIRYYFQRQSDQVGFVDTQVQGKALRLRIETQDDMLTRVRVLGSTPAAEAVVVAESLRSDRGTFRWRSRVSTYSAVGKEVYATEIDSSREKGLPNGDYVVLNDAGELGVLHMTGGQLNVTWRKLVADRSGAALQAPPAPAGEAAQAPGFDFDGFAAISSRLDGDPGRAAPRPITRAAVADNVKTYLSATWKMNAENYQKAGVSNECRPSSDKLWLRPRRLDSSVGKTIQAVPYKWGGYVSLDGYRTQLSRNSLAGSICACGDPAHNYCVVDTATGIDCSGFVSRVWDTDRYTTATLDRITDAVAWRDLKPGDALNYPGHHVRLFLARTVDAEIGFQIAESSVSCGGVCERVLNAREMEGYQPRRYKLIRD